jgi:plasmid stabilization system protein ParE
VEYALNVLPRASRQIEAAIRWWRTNRPNAPFLLEREVEAAIANLVAHPDRGIRVDGLRRMLVTPRTDRRIIYLVRPRARRVDILAILGPAVKRR